MGYFSPELVGRGGRGMELASLSGLLGSIRWRQTTEKSAPVLLDKLAQRMGAGGHGGAPRAATQSFGRGEIREEEEARACARQGKGSGALCWLAWREERLRGGLEGAPHVEVATARSQAASDLLRCAGRKTTPGPGGLGRGASSWARGKGGWVSFFFLFPSFSVFCFLFFFALFCSNK